MKKSALPIDLSADALLAKSKNYIRKALLKKAAGDLDEYQLWTSLALELLGKAVLASIHPSLIVDPTHPNSLFAASNIVISLDIKTISAHTLFDRLRQIVPYFDNATTKFCTEIALRRNAELHSGATPFKTMRLEAWEENYWYAASIILRALRLELDDWLETEQASTPKEIARHAAEARAQAVRVRIRVAADGFKSLSKKERDAALSLAASRSSYHYPKLFSLFADSEWECECPACSGKAFIAGLKFGEEVTELAPDEDSLWEEVETTYLSEQFRCPTCQLELEGAVEIEAAGLEPEHVETEQREMQYEPEYGND